MPIRCEKCLYDTVRRTCLICGHIQIQDETLAALERIERDPELVAETTGVESEDLRGREIRESIEQARKRDEPWMGDISEL